MLTNKNIYVKINNKFMLKGEIKMEKTINKKQILIAAFLAGFLTLLVNHLMNNLLIWGHQSTHGFLQQFLTYALPFLAYLVRHIIKFFCGKAFIKNNRDSLVFLGCVCFADEVSGFFENLIISTAPHFAAMAEQTSTVISIVYTVSTVIFTALSAYIGYLVFNAVCQKGDKISSGIGKARIFAVIAVVFYASATYISMELYDKIYSEAFGTIMYNPESVEYLLSNLVSWFTSAIPVVIFCIAGIIFSRKKVEFLSFTSGVVLSYHFNILLSRFIEMLLYHYVDAVILHNISVITFIIISVFAVKIFFRTSRTTEPVGEIAN